MELLLDEHEVAPISPKEADLRHSRNLAESRSFVKSNGTLVLCVNSGNHHMDALIWSARSIAVRRGFRHLGCGRRVGRGWSARTSSRILATVEMVRLLRTRDAFLLGDEKLGNRPAVLSVSQFSRSSIVERDSLQIVELVSMTLL